MSFALAVLDPFHPGAEGARVPDEYAYATETMCFKEKFPIYAPAPGGINLTFRPNLTDSLVMSDNIGATANWDMPDFGRYFRSKDTNGTGLYVTGFCDSKGESSATNSGGPYNWQRYRIVGCGIKLTTMMVPEKTSGWFGMYASPVEGMNHFALEDILREYAGVTVATGSRPVNRSGFDYQAALKKDSDFSVDPATSKWVKNVDLLMREICVPWVKLPGQTQLQISEDITDAPTGHMMNHVQFQKHGLKAALKPITSDAWDWRKFRNPYYLMPVTTGWAALVGATELRGIGYNSCLACPVYNTTTGDNPAAVGGVTTYDGVAASADNLRIPIGVQQEQVKQDGWTQFSVIGRQLPRGTTTEAVPGTFTPPVLATVNYNEPVAMVEVIYHVEYVHAALLQTSHAAVSAQNAGYMKKVMQAAAASPIYSYCYADTDGYKFNRMKVKQGL